jgi:RNA polymerase sigma-70 factor (ECF subfamily)
MAMDISLAAISDEALIDQIRCTREPQRSEDLFDELFRRYRTRVTDWCFRISKDSDRASDLAQEVFLRAFQGMGTFRGDSRLSTWLYTITRNHCFSALKRRSAAGVREELPADLPGSDGSDVHRAVEHNERFQHAWRVMQGTLTPLELRVFALHYAHEVPLADLTRTFVLRNPSGAKAYIVNARRKLNAALRDPQCRTGADDSTRARLAKRAAC